MVSGWGAAIATCAVTRRPAVRAVTVGDRSCCAPSETDDARASRSSASGAPRSGIRAEASRSFARFSAKPTAGKRADTRSDGFAVVPPHSTSRRPWPEIGIRSRPKSRASARAVTAEIGRVDARPPRDPVAVDAAVGGEPDPAHARPDRRLAAPGPEIERPARVGLSTADADRRVGRDAIAVEARRAVNRQVGDVDVRLLPARPTLPT